MTPLKIPLPKKLIEAACKNQLVLFVGAGLSYILKNRGGEELGGWDKLVRELVGCLKEKGTDLDDLKPLIGKYEPIDILNLVESNKDVSKSDVMGFVRQYYNLNKENDLSLHSKLYKLSKKIITTNYDRAFEEAEDDLRENTAFKGRDYELANHRDPETPLLFKLHGCRDAADSMILLPKSYRDLYENSNIYSNSYQEALHSLLVLRSIVHSKSILFIGCGMGDYQINSIFSEIKKTQKGHGQSHFIITKDKLESSLDFLTPVNINDFNEINSVVDSLIKEREKHLSSTNPEEAKKIKEQSEQLKKLKLQNQQLGEELNQTKDEVEKSKIRLKQNAIEYFSKGVESHMDNQLEKAIESYKIASKFDPEISEVYSNWGLALSDVGKLKGDVNLLKSSLEKYEKATQINPNQESTYYNWGTTLSNLGRIEDKASWLKSSLDKYARAIELNPKNAEAYYNWGTTLSDLGEMESKVSWLKSSIDKYAMAIELNSKNADAYYNLGVVLSDLGNIEGEANWLKSSLDKYAKAAELNPESSDIYYNWGNSLYYLGKMEGKVSWLKNSLDKYAKAAELDPESSDIYDSWGSTLSFLGEIERETIWFKKSLDKYIRAAELDPESSNIYYNWGNTLCYLGAEEGESSWFKKSLDKYAKATELNPDHARAYYNWGNVLIYLSEEEKDENLINEAFEKLTKGYELGSYVYGLSRCYSIKREKQRALELLEEALGNRQTDVSFIEQDEGWKHYWEDPGFKALLAKYSD